MNNFEDNKKLAIQMIEQLEESDSVLVIQIITIIRERLKRKGRH